jgi:alpha-amylase/alpha-mannosidase (GH57 family)
MKRHVCLHGHFYQPPRENPWLGIVERETSAAPYRDWNTRITAESYAANLAVPLSAKGAADELVDNYEKLSFNFGPTLMSWLECHAPAVYRGIQEADRASLKRFGHGNAIAQVYNHVIMPLASERDRRTQINWGLEDFRRRFSRAAESIWLSETAVDDATMESLCAAGMRFVILGSKQALRVRPIGAKQWEEVFERTFDSTQPYRWFSKAVAGKHMDIFFYSCAAADAAHNQRGFERPDVLAEALAAGFVSQSKTPQLAHMASDGEFYGHHCKEGAAALAKTMRKMEREHAATFMNYGSFLDICPPQYEAEILSPSAWSCLHGVGRWKEDCGCHTGCPSGWNQRWRAPLRDAMNRLATLADAYYAERGAAFFKDPWAAREDYIYCLYEDRVAAVKKLFAAHGTKHFSHPEVSQALRLLELQRNRLLMFTSCGWFFDDITGIEPVQIMKYAARAIELCGDKAAAFEREFETILSSAQSNIKKHGSGATVYKKMALAARVPMDAAAAAFVMRLPFTRELPFPLQQRYRFKVAQEGEFAAAGISGQSFYLHCETADSYEQVFYSALRLPGLEDGLPVFIKPCQSSGMHEGEMAQLAGAASLAQLLAGLEQSGYSRHVPAGLPGEWREIIEAFVPPDDGRRALMRQWLGALRGGAPLSAYALECLRKFDERGIPRGSVPFMEEIRRAFSARFESALETRDAHALSQLRGWAEYFAADSKCELRIMLRDFAREAGPSGGDAQFGLELSAVSVLAGASHGH